MEVMSFMENGEIPSSETSEDVRGHGTISDRLSTYLGGSGMPPEDTQEVSDIGTIEPPTSAIGSSIMPPPQGFAATQADDGTALDAHLSEVDASVIRPELSATSLPGTRRDLPQGLEPPKQAILPAHDMPVLGGPVLHLPAVAAVPEPAQGVHRAGLPPQALHHAEERPTDLPVPAIVGPMQTGEEVTTNPTESTDQHWLSRLAPRDERGRERTHSSRNTTTAPTGSSGSKRAHPSGGDHRSPKGRRSSDAKGGDKKGGSKRDDISRYFKK